MSAITFQAPLTTTRDKQSAPPKQKAYIILGDGQFAALTALKYVKMHEGVSQPTPLVIMGNSPDSCARDYCEKMNKPDLLRYEAVNLKDSTAVKTALGKFNPKGISYELEDINLDGLKEYSEEGSADKLHLARPSTEILRLIQNKGLQKDWYSEMGIPTAPYARFDSIDDIIDAYNNSNDDTPEATIKQDTLKPPFVVKIEEGGYDGKGLKIVESNNADEALKELKNMADSRMEAQKGAGVTNPKVGFVVEKKVANKIELGVLVARKPQNGSGAADVKVFPPAQMVFDKENKLSSLISPPNQKEVPEDITRLAQKITKKIANKMDLHGLLAVEFLYDPDTKEFYVNEAAPRPHNVGYPYELISENGMFEQFIKTFRGEDLGSIESKSPDSSSSALINIIGQDGNANGYKGKIELNVAGLIDFIKDPSQKLSQLAAKAREEASKFSENAIALLAQEIPENIQEIAGSVTKILTAWYGKLVKPERKNGHIALAGSNPVLLDRFGEYLNKLFIKIVPENEPEKLGHIYSDTGLTVLNSEDRDDLAGLKNALARNR